MKKIVLLLPCILIIGCGYGPYYGSDYYNGFYDWAEPPPAFMHQDSWQSPFGFDSYNEQRFAREEQDRLKEMRRLDKRLKRIESIEGERYLRSRRFPHEPLGGYSKPLGK